MDTNIKTQKTPVVFSCLSCDFNTFNKKDYTRHVLTDKHKTLTNTNINTHENPIACSCGKTYKHMSSLCAHKKKCKGVQDTQPPATNEVIDSSIIIELLKQNQEFKELLLEQNSKLIEVFKNNNSNTNIVTNNNNNSHNKTFNMNVFLNEHCKDAMNISEFVDSIQPGYDDLINIGKVGYVEGISSIIIKKLRALDIHMRPMHSGDEKRHSMYIKEDGKWAKQPEDNKEVRKLIRRVAFKNTGNTVLFKEKYPDCVTSASRYSDQYNKIVMESYGGRGASTDEEKENKIVRMIAKEVYIDKTM